MNEIICPHCKKAFKEDEAGYADILKQVRDHRFEEELQSRLNLAEKEKINAVQLAEAKLRNAVQEELTNKDKEISDLKAKNELHLAEQLAKKESEIAQMKTQIHNAELEKQLRVSEAIKNIEKERDSLQYALKNKETEIQLFEKSLSEKFTAELKTKDDIIKLKDDEIAFRKDMKQKLSTKMVGETLEQHCEIEFNKLRATAFQKAYFEKKNEDFFKELDKDRTEKKCEYAVLVSLLEIENEFYNQGIVDVSHKFDKMYVVRPQFFIPIITLLRNAAMNSMQYKAELSLIRSQNVDITNFEEKINTFNEG